jgi:hypothetical protein
MVSQNDREGYQGSELPKIDNKSLLLLAFSLKNGYPSSR